DLPVLDKTGEFFCDVCMREGGQVAQDDFRSLDRLSHVAGHLCDPGKARFPAAALRVRVEEDLSRLQDEPHVPGKTRVLVEAALVSEKGEFSRGSLSC